MKDSEQEVTEQESTTPPKPVLLWGFPPPTREPPNVRRLHERPGSKTYVEIKREDIVSAPPRARKPELEPGAIAIWVRGDAKVLLYEFEVRHLARGPRRWPR